MSSEALYGPPDESVPSAGQADARVAARTPVFGFDVSWGALLASGAVSVVIGLLVVFWPGVTVGVVAVLFGLQLLVHGVFRIVQSVTVTDASGGGRVMFALLGLLSIIVGVLCLRNVLQTVAVLALLLGLFWLVGGIIELIQAAGDGSRPDRGLTAVRGAVATLAGIVVLVWPAMTVTTLAVVLGLWLVIFGVLAIVAGLRSRAAA
jgi:uncharacterized membrane protein HdeD (DUF308 family)